MVQKVPGTQMNQTLNTDSKRLESIYAKNIVIVVIVIVFISNQQVKI